MKLITLSLALAAGFLVSVSVVHSWAIPKLQKVAMAATVAATITMSPMVGGTMDFSGSYSDPFHPNCQRVIQANGGVALIKGTDGTPGCPTDGSGKPWELKGAIDGNTILVDFRPKGGPADLKGEWDSSSPAGIKWPDGNKWAVKKESKS